MGEVVTEVYIFLSTPSVRRATCSVFCDDITFIISIHALREEGDHAKLGSWLCCVTISIHALREEGDSCARLSGASSCDFYPRPP